MVKLKVLDGNLPRISWQGLEWSLEELAGWGRGGCSSAGMQRGWICHVAFSLGFILSCEPALFPLFLMTGTAAGCGEMENPQCGLKVELGDFWTDQCGM